MSPSLSVLLIEDSPSFATAVEAALRIKAPRKFDIKHTGTLAGGLELLQLNDYDVVLLDLSLPDSEELESLRRVRKTAPLLPVIVLSGNQDEDIAVQAVQEGAQDYLLKGDLDGRMLARTMRYAVERGRLLQQRDEFMAALVHDIKNPLLGSDRMYELILQKKFGELEPKLQEMTKLLKRSNESVLHLLMNLLEIYRYDVASPLFKYEVLDLNDVLDNSVQELTPLAKLKGLDLNTDFKCSKTKINGDPTAMQRVFLNLIGNSIKFTPDGGHVDINIESDDGFAIVKVSDNGSGISETDHSYLFQRFYQTTGGKKHPLATGLGLYVCRQIIEAHSGKIHCEPSRATGTCIVVELPCLN
ncbi:MAG: hybrid sensor histidine kinase/response regulator [Cyanobacteria bacterium SZAS-4]|nr:hybrid sensor histidine kinase/response regulator [Cyanobacteria bacterium SZAS-4]